MVDHGGSTSDLHGQDYSQQDSTSYNSYGGYDGGQQGGYAAGYEGGQNGGESYSNYGGHYGGGYDGGNVQHQHAQTISLGEHIEITRPVAVPVYKNIGKRLITMLGFFN